MARVLVSMIFAALVSSACATAPVAVSKSELPDPLAAGWNGAPICEKLHEDARQRILRCTFPPGGGHERHFHAPHVGYILDSGRMRITDARGVREIEVRAGSTWVSEGIAWHEAVNIGETETRYLIIEAK